MNHEEISEVVTGLVLKSKLSPNLVSSELLMAPYDDIVTSYKAGTNELTDLILQHGVAPIQTSISAYESIADLKADWLQVLSDVANRTEVGNTLAKYAKHLIRGEDVDLAVLQRTVKNLGDGIKTGRRKLSEINELEDPLIPIGWGPWDDHIGGMPKSGLVVIAGNPGVGKTSLVANISAAYVGKYPEKSVFIYSLEMTAPELKERILLANPSLTEEQKVLIEINDLPLKVEDVIADAAKDVDRVGMIFVDFADLLVRGEVSESQMGAIYVTLSLGAKEIGCPIVLLSQLSRGYQGGVPRPRHIRYTSLAEALASQLVMLYNPSIDFYEASDSENDLLPNKKLSYLIYWKVRSGFRKHPNDGPGAVGVAFDGTLGWKGNRSIWTSLKNSK